MLRLSPEQWKDARRRIRLQMQARGMSDAELADRIKVSPSAVSNWLNEVNNISAKNAKKVAEAFGLSIEALFGPVQEETSYVMHDAPRPPGSVSAAMARLSRMRRDLDSAREEVDLLARELVDLVAMSPATASLEPKLRGRLPTTGKTLSADSVVGKAGSPTGEPK